MERIMITAPLIALIIIGLVLVLRFINKGEAQKKKPKKKVKAVFMRPSADDEQTLDTTAQEELGLSDLMGPDLIMRDGSIINIFSVACNNVSLLTTAESIEEAKRTSRVLSTLRQGFQIIKYHRPADNSKQIRMIKATIEEVEGKLRAMQATDKLSRPQEHERTFLIKRHDILSKKYEYELENERRHGQSHVTETVLCVKTPAGKNSQRTAQETARQLLSRFSANGYSASRGTDLELIDILKAYFDEPAGPKINIDPLHQIPSLDFRLRAGSSSVFEDPTEPELEQGEDEELVPKEEEMAPPEDPEREIYEILAELDSLSNEEKVVKHVA